MRQRSGFTLVELSIVLVIIGLLIGGILAAQSMISTAKINAQVRQIGQFDAAVMSFKTRYNYLPGDAPSFGGDGDGAIDRSAIGGANQYVDAFESEIAQFWSNLFPQEFSVPNNTPYITLSGAGKNVPLSKIGKKNSFWIAAALSGGDRRVDTNNLSNYYILFDPDQAKPSQYAGGGYGMQFAGTSSLNSPLKPIELLSLDTKMDDGIGNTGNVQSAAIGPSGNALDLTPLAACSDSSTGAYTTNDNYVCTAAIRIGGSVGVPQ